MPVMGYVRTAGVPAVSVARWTGTRPSHRPPSRTHAHDFLVVLFVEHGDGRLRVDDRTWSLAPGDVFVIAPGAVVTPDGSEHEHASVWAVFFPADLVDPAAPTSPLAWRAHPLLYPFTRDRGGGKRLRVPPEDRGAWLRGLSELEAELRGRREGYAEAAHAHLTLLLVRLGRLDTDVPAELRAQDEPLLAGVFDVLESRYHEPITLRDVASAVGLTPGHVTTVVRRRTGRPVGQWVTERRMQEARRLLADTDLTVAAIAGRIGYRDAGYFIRRFRRAHGVPPQEWRRATPQ
ncbi:MAG: AraC family transcriptional regulator [Actinomycetota bacterium]|nr:AraC family transcriptional regulator [Actinomycetota bacterium]